MTVQANDAPKIYDIACFVRIFNIDVFLQLIVWDFRVFVT